MILVLFALFGVAAIALMLFSGLSTQKLIRDLYKEKGVVPSPSPEPTPTLAAMREVLRLKDVPTVGGVGVAEQAFRSLLIFQVGALPSNATLDATMIGLNALEFLDSFQFDKDVSSEKTQEILFNAGRSLRDLLPKLLVQDTGGAKVHPRGYPLIYGCYYFVQGAKRLQGVKWGDPLTYERLVDQTSKKDGEQFLAFIKGCSRQFDVDGKRVLAFAETPTSRDVGTIYTGGGATQILAELLKTGSHMDWSKVEFTDSPLQELRNFLNLCKVQLDNGGNCYGFTNDVKVKEPQVTVTRHALKTYDVLTEMESKNGEATAADAGAIACFLGTCRQGGGFSRTRGEQPSVFHTNEVVCCSNYSPFNKYPAVIRSLVDYEETIAFLESRVANDRFGWAEGTSPNIYVAKATAYLLHKLTNPVSGIYREEGKLDKDRVNRLAGQIRGAVLAHFDVKSGLAIGYRPILRMDYRG